MMYENKELLYRYKDLVEIPSLGMVDDIMSIQKCSGNTVANNAVVRLVIFLGAQASLELAHVKTIKIE